MVDIQEQRNASQEAYEKANLHKELHEINAEKERFRESYNRAVHEINRVTHENERMKNELSSTNYSPTSPPAQSHEQLNFGSPVFGTKATLFGRQSDPNQGTSAERSSFAPYKTGAFPIMSPVQGRDSNTTDPQARSTGPPEIVQQGWQQPGGAAGTVQQGWQSSWGPGSQGPAAHFGQGPPQGNAPSFQGFSPRSNPYGQGPAPGNEGNRSHNEGQDRGGNDRAPITGNQGQGGPKSFTEQSSDQGGNEQGGNEDWPGDNHDWTGENIPKHLIRKEAEKIVFPPFPDVISWRAWKSSAIHAVVQASARPDPEAIIEWIKQSFEKGKR